MLAKAGGIGGGIETAAAQLTQEHAATPGDVGAENPGLVLQVVVVPGVAIKVRLLPSSGVDVVAEITPACGFRHHGPVHQVRSGPPDRTGGRWREGSAIEEMPMGAVGEAHEIFGIGNEILVQTAGAPRSVAAGYVGVKGVGKRLRIVDDTGSIRRNGEFRIPGQHEVAGSSPALPGRPPVVSVPVGVSHEKVEEHVVNEGVHVEVVLDRTVTGWIGNITVGNRDHGVPGRRVATAGLAGAESIVVFALSSEVGSHEVSVRAFVHMVEPPVKSVEVEVNPSPVRARLPHGEVEIVHPLVPVVLSVAGLVVVSVRPGEIESRP